VRELLIAMQPAAPDLSTDEWLRQFHAWMATHAGNTVVLPDDAMERESIYGDHGR